MLIPALNHSFSTSATNSQPGSEFRQYSAKYYPRRASPWTQPHCPIKTYLIRIKQDVVEISQAQVL